MNHGGRFEYEYDALGNLSSTTFPDGRELATLRYGTGSHRRPVTIPSDASRSARCWMRAASWCLSAATAGTAPTR
ncbi:hypothetical protein SOJ85_004047 [Cronobacter turicensis]|nr:hypothetical protein [Cronobacter turicensis]